MYIYKDREYRVALSECSLVSSVTFHALVQNGIRNGDSNVDGARSHCHRIHWIVVNFVQFSAREN